MTLHINVLSSEGVHPREIKGLEAIEASLPQEWIAYAALELVDRKEGNMQLDLILVAPDRIILVEIKDWNGTISQKGDLWYVNNASRGRSPVQVISEKARKFKSRLMQRISGKIHSPWVDSCVLLTGEQYTLNIEPDEESFTIPLATFLCLGQRKVFKKYFPFVTRHNDLNKQRPVFKQFFNLRTDFRRQEQTFHNYRTISAAIFSHPTELYQEFESVRLDNKNHRALLRLWNLDTLGVKHATLEARKHIILRESDVLAYLSTVAPSLVDDNYLLRQLSTQNPAELTERYFELYELPRVKLRLSEFLIRNDKRMNTERRVDVIKALLGVFSTMHRANVSHRDIGAHSVWLSLPAKVAISSLVVATFPDSKTVGPVRPLVQVSTKTLPEDVFNLDVYPGSDFQRDVFQLGTVCFRLAFGVAPPSTDGYPEWIRPVNTDFPSRYDNWFKRAMRLEPRERFLNATDMLAAFVECNPSEIATFDSSVLVKYETEILPSVDYPVMTEVSRGSVHVFRSQKGCQTFCVKIWYQAQRTSDIAVLKSIHRMCETADKLKGSGINELATIENFGLSAQGLFLVTQWIDGYTLHDWLAFRTSYEPKVALVLAQSLVKAVGRLSTQGFAHGDLHASNIHVTKDERAVKVIDYLEYVAPGMSEAHNTQYAPSNPTRLSLSERDRYATFMLVSEILGANLQRTSDVFSVVACPDDHAEIVRACVDALNHERAVPQLEFLVELLYQPVEQLDSQNLVSYNVSSYHIQSKVDLDSNDGNYAISIQKFRNDPQLVSVEIYGSMQKIGLLLNPKSGETKNIRIGSCSYDQSLSAFRRTKRRLQGTIHLHTGQGHEASDIVQALKIELQAFAADNTLGAPPTASVEDTCTDRETTDTDTRVPWPTVEQFWEANLDQEEILRPTIRVRLLPKEERERGLIFLPYEGEPPDFDDGDVVNVISTRFEEERSIGRLEPRLTSTVELAIRPRLKFPELRVGTQLILESQRNRSSFERRRAATTRIVGDRALIPKLFDLFSDPHTTKLREQSSPPTREELNIYSLNERQIEAMEKIVQFGPVGILQGPPGTGKTYFVGALIHFLLTTGRAKNILLVSQSHEGVNNACEKLLDVFNSLCHWSRLWSHSMFTLMEPPCVRPNGATTGSP